MARNLFIRFLSPFLTHSIPISRNDKMKASAVSNSKNWMFQPRSWISIHHQKSSLKSQSWIVVSLYFQAEVPPTVSLIFLGKLRKKRPVLWVSKCKSTSWNCVRGKEINVSSVSSRLVITEALPLNLLGYLVALVSVMWEVCYYLMYLGLGASQSTFRSSWFSVKLFSSLHQGP